MAHHQSFIADLADAIRSHQSLPAFPAGLTLEEAYAMLPDVAAMVCDSGSRGIKAGLTNPDLQQLFGLDEPLLGLLYDWGECQQNAVLAYRDHAQIECEIGVRLGVEGKPISLGPAIEIVHLDFSKPEDFTAPNLVACSLGADRFICGDQLPWYHADFEALRRVTIKLYRDGDLLLQASPYDSLDGPERAVDWCLAEASRRDIEVSENAILLTGTCGGALPVTPGKYVADYGPLGRLAFEIDGV